MKSLAVFQAVRIQSRKSCMTLFTNQARFLHNEVKEFGYIKSRFVGQEPFGSSVKRETILIYSQNNPIHKSHYSQRQNSFDSQFEELEMMDKRGDWKRAPDQFSIWNYADLSKSKLASFVLLTTMAGYALAPGAASMSNLLLTTIGTGLCVASANSINQWIEIPYDAQMARTRNRVLVRHSMTPAHAFLFGGISGITGTAILATVSPLAAALGFANIFLYTCVYTPMKRTSIYNTWPGSIVGAIPPIIGWTACSGSIDAGAILLALSLYAWQFPHFNSLSWNLRPDYSKAGYMMMSVLDPFLNARVSLRYALAMFPISLAFYICDVTSFWFLLDSSIVNGYMSWHAFQFWRESTDSRARALFFSSLVHLPVFLILLMLHKEETKEKNI